MIISTGAFAVLAPHGPRSGAQSIFTPAASMAEIIKFVPRSSSAIPLIRDRRATATTRSRNDRVLVLVAHERYWGALATVARRNALSDQAQHFEERAEAVFDEIARTKANTIEGVIAQLRCLFYDRPDWVELIAASLWEIAGSRESAPPDIQR